jgi:anti-sigma28 factor (negative regulator of flagellin synthesis)
MNSPSEATMKIDDRVSNFMSILSGDTVNPISNAKEGADVPAVPDKVTISPVAVQLSDDDARRERLVAIQLQLSEGTYNISGKDVANKIINILKS